MGPGCSLFRKQPEPKLAPAKVETSYKKKPPSPKKIRRSLPIKPISAPTPQSLPAKEQEKTAPLVYDSEEGPRNPIQLQ